MNGAGSGFSSVARHQAQEILSRPPYRTGPDKTPRPLAGLFHALGRALETLVYGPARWLYHHVLLRIGHGFTAPFGRWWPLPAALLAIACGALLGILLVRRRSRITGRGHSAQGRIRTEDPDELEVRAAAAEAEGDREAAVRLRFRAGLVRLVSRGLLVDHGARTDRELATMLSSRTFEQLATRHERIVYGRVPATPEDCSDARLGWPRVLVEVSSAPVGE